MRRRRRPQVWACRRGGRRPARGGNAGRQEGRGGFSRSSYMRSSGKAQTSACSWRLQVPLTSCCKAWANSMAASPAMRCWRTFGRKPCAAGGEEQRQQRQRRRLSWQGSANETHGCGVQHQLRAGRQVGRRYLMPVLHQLADRICRLYQRRQQGRRRRGRARGGPVGVLGLHAGSVGSTALSSQACR